MVSRVMPRTAPETLEAFELRADAAMAHVLRALPTLPILPGDDYKYSEETVQPCHGGRVASVAAGCFGGS
jgi:hypothetical protein